MPRELSLAGGTFFGLTWASAGALAPRDGPSGATQVAHMQALPCAWSVGSDYVVVLHEPRSKTPRRGNLLDALAENVNTSPFRTILPL